MNGRRRWSEWTLTAVAVGVCVGAFLLRARARQVGHDANAMGLLACHILRLLLLLLAWAAVATLIKTAVRREEPATPRGVTVFDLLGGFLILPGCCGLHPFWPAILLLLAAPALLELIFSRHAAARPPGMVLLRVGVGVLLFTLTWYLCASMTQEALRGLGERIEERCGADRLRAWAEKVIASRKKTERSPQLEPEELPDFVDDLLGRFQGVRGGFVRLTDDPHVILFTGGSAYHFQIGIYPSEVDRPPPPWWAGEDARTRLPGIYLSTGGK